jgi:hypothetical protein
MGIQNPPLKIRGARGVMKVTPFIPLILRGKRETLIFEKEFVGNTKLLRFQGTDGETLFPARERNFMGVHTKTIDNFLDSGIIVFIRIASLRNSTLELMTR